MKVLILNDHPASKGAELALLHGLCHGIGAHHEIQWVETHELDLQACRSCLKCRPYGECVLPEDDAHRIARMLFCAGGLVVGLSPAKPDLSDRFHCLLERSLSALAYPNPAGEICPWRQGRPAVVVTVGGLVETGNAAAAKGIQPALRQLLDAGGFKVIGGELETVEGVAGAGLPLMVRAENLGRLLSADMAFSV